MSLAVAILGVAAAVVVSFGLVAVTAAVCSWLRRPAPAGRAAVTESARAEPACPVQLMFVCHVGDALLLDGVLLGPAWSDHGLIPAGTPLTMRLGVPRDMVVAAGMANVLRRWTDEASVVRARFREDADGVRTQFTNGDVRLMVDLEDVLLAPQS